MVDSNKINPLSRTWPAHSTKKDRANKKNFRRSKKEKKNPDSENKDPGDTIIDEYV